MRVAVGLRRLTRDGLDFSASRHNLVGRLITFSSLMLCLCGVAQATIPATERAVLLAFYQQTGGASWKTNSGWNGAVGTECSWYGVTCDAAQQDVTGISMWNNNLTGSMPDLSNLGRLQTFDIYNNQVSGHLPELASLHELQTFRVSMNALSGTLPSLSGLTNLQVLDVGQNQFSGSIPSLSGLSSLQQVSFYVNDFTGSLPDITGLTNLVWFSADYNQLSGSIPSLSGSPSLQLYEVSYNNLSGGIPSLDNVPFLGVLDVANNNLTGTVPSLSNLTHLESLIVAFNQLSGVLPEPPAGTPHQGSALCPNLFDHTPSAAWDKSTGDSPWYDGLRGLYPCTAQTQTTISVSPTSPVFGEPVTITATVSSDESALVKFEDGNSLLCTPILAVTGQSGSAQCSPQALGAGTHQFKASFAGTAGDSSSQSTIATTIDKASTTLTLSPPLNATQGQELLVYANLVVVAPGQGEPTGVIIISDGVDSCTVVGGGCSLTPTTVGNLTLTATYAGDNNFKPSSASAALTVMAGPPNPVVSTIELDAASGAPIVEGHTVQLTAAVSAQAPTGTISFYDIARGNLCSNVAVTGSGNAATATCSHVLSGIGIHQIQATYSGDGVNLSSVSTPLRQFVVTATPVNMNQFGITGAWYNPATSGQGLLLDSLVDLGGTGKGLLFGGWFSFDTPHGIYDASAQRWYTLQGDVGSTDSYVTLPIYSTTGGAFATPPIVKAYAVGQASLQFSDCAHGMLSYDFNDGSQRSGNIPLTRLDANIACATSGTSSAALSNYPLSGAWYDPGTSGQGLLFDVNPQQSVLFAAWYTFTHAPQSDAKGQRWYTLQIGGFAPGAHAQTAVPIFSATGGAFDDQLKVTTTQVGTADIAFQSCDKMTLAYTFSDGENKGRSGTINLVRAGPTPAACKF